MTTRATLTPAAPRRIGPLRSIGTQVHNLDPSRQSGSPGPVGFALQGGGSLTASQVGMLRALSEAGIHPDIVVGSSAGALNAVAYAADPTVTGVDRLEHLWLTMRRRHVAPLAISTIAAAVAGRRDGLFNHDAMRELLRRARIPAMLDRTRVPVHVVATDLATGAPAVLGDGDTVTALLATSAFPGLYPPVRLGSMQLIDGGVSADIPILQAEALGAATTFILPAASSDEVGWQPRGPLALAYHALGQILDTSANHNIEAAQGTVHLLPAPASRASNPLDFRYTKRLVDDGYRLASNWLAAQTVPNAAAVPRR